MEPICFTACNFESIYQIGTKFGTNQRYFILSIAVRHNLFESPSENKRMTTAIMSDVVYGVVKYKKDQ